MRALVLSGGGSKGIFQVGVLKNMLNKDPTKDYDIYVGSSSGALNAYILSTDTLDKSLPILEKFWLEKANNKNIYGYKNILIVSSLLLLIVTNLTAAAASFGSIFLLPFSFIFAAACAILYKFISNTYSIYDTSFLLKELYAANLTIKKKLSVGTVRVTDGLFLNITEANKHIKDFTIASASFPVYFSPIEIGGEIYIDGGLVNLASIDEAIKRGATEIDVILCSKFTIDAKKPKNIVDIIFASLNIMSNEIVLNDICANRKGVKIKMYQPSFLVTKNILNFDSKEIKSSYTLAQDDENVYETVLS